MELLEQRILTDGKLLPGGILKVDSFLNHQIDPLLLRDMAREWKRLFADVGVNKILTIEASGIAMAVLVGLEFECPVVFAKKSRSLNLAGDVYCVEVPSFTHKNVNKVIISKAYLGPSDRVLLIDDFLASGAALIGLKAPGRRRRAASPGRAGRIPGADREYGRRRDRLRLSVFRVLKGPRAAVFPSRGDYKVKISEPLAAQGFQVFEVFFQVCACYTNYNCYGITIPGTTTQYCLDISK